MDRGDHEGRLLQRVAAGDADAARELVRVYGDLVWSLAGRYTSSRAEAEEAAQDVFVHLWQKAAMFDPRQGAEDTFVGVLARRRLIDRWRRESRAPIAGPISEEVPAADAPGGPSEDVAVARSIFDQLGEPARNVLRLSIGFGYSHQMIASHTGLPLGTVKTLIRSGLTEIRERLTGSARRVTR